MSTALGVICVGAGLAAWSGLLQRFCGKREAKYQRVPTNGAQLPRAARAALTPPISLSCPSESEGQSLMDWEDNWDEDEGW